MSAEYVIERAAANVRQRLAARNVSERVYAVALFSADHEALFATEITLGLERDRAEALASLSPYDAFWRTWNAEELALECPRAPSLWDDADFAAAQESLYPTLGLDPQRHVLNRVAARLSADHPLPAVTDDFVVYAFSEDFEGELLANIAFSASPAAAASLRAKGLLPEDPTALAGF